MIACLFSQKTIHPSIGETLIFSFIFPDLSGKLANLYKRQNNKEVFREV